MSNKFKLVMISAMYENGGNVMQRFLDGHPELFVYPFESQLGNDLFSDYLSSLFPFKYRWPEFPLSGSVDNDYDLFYDEEFKVRIRTPDVSKFKKADIELNEDQRKKVFNASLKNKPRSRRNIIEAFFISTFESWNNFNRSGKESAYVGYSPIIIVDTEKILADFPDAHIVHVIRNPYSAYAETRQRPFPLSIHRYTLTWNIVQLFALVYSKKYPESVHLVKYEDLIQDPKKILSKLCKNLGISFTEKILYPSWNGIKLKEVYPWGTIKQPSEKENEKKRKELSVNEKEIIISLSSPMLKLLDYDDK